MKAWINQHPHFDNVVTSRVEGMHWLLRSHLKVSRLDLFEAWRLIKLALLNQLAESRSNQAKQKIRTPIELSGVLYGAVRGWVSHEVLRKVEQQRRLLFGEGSPPSPTYTSSFTRSQGLPCVHKLEILLTQGQALQLEDFHPHWHLTRKDNLRPLLEPRQRIDPITVNSALSYEALEENLAALKSSRTRDLRERLLCAANAIY